MDLNLELREIERRYKRRMRRSLLFSAAMVVFFFGHMVALIVASNHGWLDLMVRYVIVLGMIGIVGGIALIVYLLSRPPFSTGDVRATLMALRAARRR